MVHGSSDVSSGGSRNPVEDIVKWTKLTAEACVKMATASGLSVAGFPANLKPMIGMGAAGVGHGASVAGAVGPAGAAGASPGAAAAGVAGVTPGVGGAPGGVAGITPPTPSPLKFGGGSLGQAASVFKGGGGAYAAVLQGLQQATRAGNIVQDPFATEEMKARSLFKSFVPGGETLLGFKDMVTGRQAGMERAHYEGELARVDVQGRLNRSDYQLNYRPQQAGYEARAQAYAGQSAVTAGVFNRGTAEGKTAYEDAQRLLPLRKETARLERESASASAQRLASERELERVQKVENSLIRERQNVQAKIKEGGSGVQYQRLLERDKTLAAEIDGSIQQTRQARQQATEATRNEVEIRAETQKAKIREDLLGKAEQLDVRAQRSESSAARLGSMNPFQRQVGLAGIKQIESGANPWALPEFVRTAAQQFDPESYDRAIKQVGLNSPEFQERQRAGKRGFEGDYTKLYEQADTLRQQAGEAEFGIEKTTSDKIAKAGADLGAFISGEIAKYTENVKASILTRLKEGRNATS